MIKKRKFTLMIAFVILIGIIAVAGSVGLNLIIKPPVIPSHVEVVRQDNSSETDFATAAPPEIIGVMERKSYFYTFLFFATDSGNNADVIIVGAFDTINKQAYAISVPRDTRIDVERNLRKPVASYAVGRAGGRGHDGGVTQMLTDIQTLFGFVPDFYISINEQAFIRIIDSVGGVTVDVPFDMRYNDPTQRLNINISQGEQKLDGQQAMHFARYRMGNRGYRTITDYQRIENQQKIIHAMLDEILSPRTIIKIPELLSIYREYVNTDLKIGQQLWFAEQLLGTTLFTYTLPTSGTSGSPGWYELPDAEAILELINETVNPFTQEITGEMVSIIEN